MDTLQELCNAFKKIIIDYKNIKCSEHNTLANEPASIQECINKTRDKELSKSSHLILFYEVIQSIDLLLTTLKDNPSNNSAQLKENISLRTIYKDSLINLIHELYVLNHSGRSFTSKFGGGSYTLSTTKAYGGYFTGLTELGLCIREQLLIPLNASGIFDESKVIINIEQSLNIIFDKITYQEETALLLKEKDEKIDGLEQQLRQTHSVAESVRSTTKGMGFFDKSLSASEQNHLREPRELSTVESSETISKGI